jgi:hypothetical protein
MWTSCCRLATIPWCVFDRNIPQGVHTSTVALEFVDNVEIVYPLSIAVDAAHVSVSFALLPNFTPQQAVVYRVLHLDYAPYVASLVEVANY